MNNIDYSYLGVEGLEGNRIVKVTNMSRFQIGYSLPEKNVTRSFGSNIYGRNPDSKMLTFDEIFTLWNSTGGEQLIYDALLIEDMEVRKALGLPYEEADVVELSYTREDIYNLLKNGTEDEILDALEFGPFYIAEWIKEDIRNIDSSSRRKFVGDIFNINVDNLEENLNWAAEDDKAGALGYATIKGLDVSGAGETAAGSKRRTAGKGSTQSAQTDGVARPLTSNRRRSV